MQAMKKRGFVVSDLVPLSVSFVVIAIVIGLGATILSNIKTGQITSNGATEAINATQYGLTSLSTMGQYLPTLAIVVVAAVIIGVILTYFRFN
jgi:hypothetical protein